MKIQSLVLASAAALAFSAPSFAADWFVGGGVGAQQNDYSHKPLMAASSAMMIAMPSTCCVVVPS